MKLFLKTISVILGLIAATIIVWLVAIGLMA
jgi:hypothetical protein